MIIDTLLAKVIGTQNERELKRIRPLVAEINAQEPAIQTLSDEALRGKTPEFRQRLANGETLDDLLPEAFAVVREAGKRTLNMRHFDVQLIGGVVLHRGRIAEMKTGEGKTLVATLPAYLNALESKGVHVVTVNDYLAKRDSEWMGPIFRALGISEAEGRERFGFLLDALRYRLLVAEREVTRGRLALFLGFGALQSDLFLHGIKWIEGSEKRRAPHWCNHNLTARPLRALRPSAG